MQRIVGYVILNNEGKALKTGGRAKPWAKLDGRGAKLYRTEGSASAVARKSQPKEDSNYWKVYPAYVDMT